MIHEPFSWSAIAAMIDHSLLHPTLTDAEIRSGCGLAVNYQVAAVCVKPYSIPLAKQCTAGSKVAVCAVVGFPHGNSATSLKVAEAQAAASEGATELDMVINVGKTLGADWAYVREEIRAVNQSALQQGAILKVIFENDYLPDPAIIKLCEICSEIQVAFVKTSTGYGFVKQPNGSYAYRGATERQVRLMRQHSAPGIQIKAAGGIRTLDELLLMRSRGVSRVGATATAEIVEEARRRTAGAPSSAALSHI